MYRSSLIILGAALIALQHGRCLALICYSCSVDTVGSSVTYKSLNYNSPMSGGAAGSQNMNQMQNSPSPGGFQGFGNTDSSTTSTTTLNPFGNVGQPGVGNPSDFGQPAFGGPVQSNSTDSTTTGSTTTGFTTGSTSTMFSTTTSGMMMNPQGGMNPQAGASGASTGAGGLNISVGYGSTTCLLGWCVSGADTCMTAKATMSNGFQTFLYACVTASTCSSEAATPVFQSVHAGISSTNVVTQCCGSNGCNAVMAADMPGGGFGSTGAHTQPSMLHTISALATLVTVLATRKFF